VESTLELFVYGSLKLGECNDFVIKEWVVDWQPATVRGQMRLRPDNYPALFVDLYGRLGSADYLRDLELNEAPVSRAGQVIQGQLLRLNPGVLALPRLDELEGYFPGSYSEYLRVAVSASTSSGERACWTYTGVGQPRADWCSIDNWPPEGLAVNPDPYQHGL